MRGETARFDIMNKGKVIVAKDKRITVKHVRDLEAAGLVERTVIPSSPPTVEYRLTERGRKLGPIIDAMRAYAREPVG